ncbi:D-2-hydroxyacid dehydrogenase [Pseudolysinimonas sp.]|uniref:D-2-hydroxyacid dehydrogenase n=1 Tax=Pseudolysinimonas sp. TaxID=2680009 RepID=UPI00286B8E72|nr:D-2-hydroxyacid dehydrogenase [Pseudolysinimonas sp.]
MSTPTTLRVAVATPLTPELAAEIVRLEPRVDLAFEPDLLPEARYPGDHVGDPGFRRSPAEQARFHELVDSAEALYGVPDETPAELRRTADANPALRWVHTMPAGGGGQLRAAALTRDQLQRIAVSTSAGVHAEPLAEFALLGVLAGAKTLPRLRVLQDRAEWPERWVMPLLSEQRVMVAGFGHIGRATARKLRALGATVAAVARSTEFADEADEIIAPDDLIARIADFDAVVITLPGTDKTTGLFDDAVFGAMRRGATVVNVGRGTVIAEDALVRALVDGRVGFAALDVFAAEPLAADSPLWNHPAVLVSPHTAGLNPGEDRLIARLFAENASRLLDGRELLNRVNTVEFY